MNIENFTNLFSNLQDYVSQILNADEILQQMGASFIAENSLDIEYELKNALNKQGLACAVMTPRAQYQGHNGIEQIFTCDELTIQIVENPIINRARLKKAGLEHGTALDVAKAASDRLSGPQGGYFGKFTTKRIQESEVGGLLVVTATFGCTVYDRLSAVPSGDISGNWVEVPFVRISELSGWLDDWLSSNISAIVDLEPYRQKLDLSTYTEQWASWTFDGDRELTYAGFDERLQSYTWSYRRGLSLGWRHLTYFAGDEQHSAGWYVSIGEMPNLTNFIGGEWNDLVLNVPESLQTRWGQQITRPYVGGLMPDGDRFALSSEVADLSVQFGGMIDTKRGKGDLSVYSETEPYVPTGDRLAKMSDISAIDLTEYRQKLDLSTYVLSTIVDVTSPWTVQYPGYDPAVLEWDEDRGLWHDTHGEVELTYDAFDQYWYADFYLQGTSGVSYASQDALELEFDVDGTTVTAQREASQIMVPDGDTLARESELSNYCLQEYAEDIDRMKREKTDLSAYNSVYSQWVSDNGTVFPWWGERTSGTPMLIWNPGAGGLEITMRLGGSDYNRWGVLGGGVQSTFSGPPDILRIPLPESQHATLGTYVERADATRRYTPSGDRIALVKQDLSALNLKDWQNYALSSEWYNGRTMIRTYDGVQHWVNLSSNTIINQTIFNQAGFNFTNDPVSGIMDIAFGKGLFPHNTINLATSKVKHVWYPSQLSTMGQNGFNNCLELETILMADYDPGEMAKTLRLNHRAFRNCPKLSRVELPALSVVVAGSGHFDGTPLTAQSEWPDLEPGLWMYGWMKGETDAKQNLSGLLNLPPETIHVGYPRKEESGEYLPLSGGTMTGEVKFQMTGKAASIFDGETLRLDPGAIGETSVSFPIMGGSHEVAYSDKVWQKSDTELSVGVGRYKAYMEPGELLARDDGLGGSDPQKKTQYMWDGMVYTVVDNSGPTTVTNNYNLMYPTENGTFATREWTNDIIGDISTLIHNT